MNSVEKWGDDVESAVQLALADLKATRDQVDVEVLKQASRGFFGIGSKLAFVRVTMKTEKQPEEEASFEKKAPAGKNVLRSESPAPAPVSAETEEEKVTEVSESEDEAEQAPSLEEPAEEAAAADADVERPHHSARTGRSSGEGRERWDRRDHRDRRGGRRGQRSGRSREDIVLPPPDLSDLDFHKTMDGLPIVEDHPALSFLKDVTREMGLDLNLVCRADETRVFIEISGPDSRTIIGKRGQTLDAVQYLTSLVVNRDQKEYVKVVLDAENYRARREKTLEQLADRLARKVVRTGRTVRLEPMNPYERKVIHATLQRDPRVVTRSEGQDPYRRVIIELK